MAAAHRKAPPPTPKVTDLSDLGGVREQVKLPNGELYDVLGPQDFSPTLAARFQTLSVMSEKLQGSNDEDDAVELEDLLRQEARLVCPTIPEDVAQNLPFQLAAGIVSVFLLGVGPGGGGMAPVVQQLLDRVQSLNGPS